MRTFTVFTNTFVSKPRFARLHYQDTHCSTLVKYHHGQKYLHKITIYHLIFTVILFIVFQPTNCHNVQSHNETYQLHDIE